MNKQKIFAPHSAQRGVVLVEAMIAILIFSVGILAITGLQAAMIKNTSDSKFRADASFIAQKLIGQMWSDQSNLASYLGNNIPVSELPNGTVTATQSGVQVTVTVTWQQPGESQHNFTTTASVTGG
jgi:type IV pilus assembly protein PilV